MYTALVTHAAVVCLFRFFWNGTVTPHMTQGSNSFNLTPYLAQLWSTSEGNHCSLRSTCKGSLAFPCCIARIRWTRLLSRSIRTSAMPSNSSPSSTPTIYSTLSNSHYTRSYPKWFPLRSFCHPLDVSCLFHLLLPPLGWLESLTDRY
jgi:hypothetical protein